MNFLVIGDVVGRSGRTALKENLKKIQDQFNISFTIINAENSAGGYGLTGKIYEELISWGADAVTLGNHAWKQKEIIETNQSSIDAVDSYRRQNNQKVADVLNRLNGLTRDLQAIENELKALKGESNE